MVNEIVVYTALFGAYDELVDPIGKFENCDFICFTDQKSLKSDVWDIKIVTDFNLTNAMMNRKFKLLPHEYLNHYEFSLYIDANILVKGNPNMLVEKYLRFESFAVPMHLSRCCVFEEARECLVLNRASFTKIMSQMRKYRKFGMPTGFGLSENGIMLRRHNDPVLINLMLSWWHEINIETQRDQLSLPFVLWRNGKEFNFMDESIRIENKYFELNDHKHAVTKSLLGKVVFKITVMLKRAFLSFLIFKI